MKQIHNCPSMFANQCPKAWQQLQPTGDEQRRYCSTCENSVYECRSPDELVQLGLQGKCVAIPDHVFEQGFRSGIQTELNDDSSDPMIFMGFLSQEHVEKVRELFEQVKAWTSAADTVSRNEQP